MERGFNAYQTHRNMYPSIFNRFPVIQPVSLKVRHFSTFFAHFGLPGYASGTIAVNVTVHGWKEDSMLVKRIAAYTHLSSTFYKLARYWSEIATFSYPLAFNDPVWGDPIGIPGKSLDHRKLESWGYQAVKTV